MKDEAIMAVRRQCAIQLLEELHMTINSAETIGTSRETGCIILFFNTCAVCGPTPNANSSCL